MIYLVRDPWRSEWREIEADNVDFSNPGHVVFTRHVPFIGTELVAAIASGRAIEVRLKDPAPMPQEPTP